MVNSSDYCGLFTQNNQTQNIIIIIIHIRGIIIIIHMEFISYL